MSDGPVALGVHQRIEVRVLLVQQLLGPEAVKPQQPVRLIQAVLPQQRGLRILGGQQTVLDYRYIGGIEHSFETVLLVQRLGQVQDMAIIVRRGAHNELSALSGRGKHRGVAGLHQLCLALSGPVPNLCHGPQNGLFAFIRSQRL